MRTILTGVATVALLTSGAYAQGKGNGQGGDNGKGNAQASQGKQDRGDRGKGNAKSERGQQDRGSGKAERGQGKESRKPDRAERASNKDDGNSGNRGAAQDRSKPDRAERDLRPAPVRDARNVSERFDERRTADRSGNRPSTVRYADRRDDDRYGYIARDRDRSAIDGCPPGLAKKNNGCTPPGLARNRERTIFGYDYRPRYFGLTSYRDDRYRYDDGYLVRYGDDDRVSGWIPLLGGALAVGNVWPQQYESYALPSYYVDYYDLGGADRYRYADNVIYRVDREQDAITSIAALLTGDRFVVGQPMPSGYDVYNVPYGYRDRYADSPEAMYRYSDGQVYQMDPTTQIVQAVISLLV